MVIVQRKSDHTVDRFEDHMLMTFEVISPDYLPTFLLVALAYLPWMVVIVGGSLAILVHWATPTVEKTRDKRQKRSLSKL